MKVAYYVTSHGYGHAVRTAAICNEFSSGTELVFRTGVPRSFFEEEVNRPFDYAAKEFDCGCRQFDGVTVDIDATLALYKEIASRNAERLDDEARWCAENGVSVIASDIAPFAFEVAKHARIPSAAVTNFTWYTIYEEYAAHKPEFIPYLDKMKSQYALADLCLSLYPAADMPYFARTAEVGPVGRVGTDVRDRIAGELGIDAGKRLALIYVGNFGMDAVVWGNLGKIDGWEFFGLYPLPGAPANYHVISKSAFRYQDCVASADAMVGKLGYGTCAECLLSGLPIVYLPRTEFAEYPVLHAAMQEWGHGYLVSPADFYSLAWNDALGLVQGQRKPARMPSGGARACAAEIERLAAGSRA